MKLSVHEAQNSLDHGICPICKSNTVTEVWEPDVFHDHVYFSCPNNDMFHAEFNFETLEYYPVIEPGDERFSDE